MTAWLLPVLAGFCTGILSAWGVGGGTLLLLLMTLFLGVEQADAMAINLLYFLPAALAALPAHRKNGLLEKGAIVPAVCAGLAASAVAAWVSGGLDTGLLRKLFGAFLLVIGLRELFQKDVKDDGKGKR